ncbi:bacterial alpha-L-rhamnosidase-domain-containing protein [Thelonectria olida]|uniref:alpha-L-rhamnosidase n=1 Tax=Thelonectria olida TaxID=1576542 RepID=A0A9P8VP24_9HYPO|nr:bacterial alpha-L-rhamnosidase-domain-containing protein [Thelonectria olida]
MRIINLRVEHYREFTVINEEKPRISWSFEGQDRQWCQKAYEFSLQRDLQCEAQTFVAVSSQSLYVPWPWRPLESCEIAALKVRAQSGDSVWTPWSSPLQIEVGLLKTNDWHCFLIQPSMKRDPSAPLRPVRFRRPFRVKEAPHRARLYITAQGIYESFINGSKVGDHVLAPGWTSYDHELSYQTFDVLPQLKIGMNVIAAEVAEGWYCGRLGFMGGQRNIWGFSVGLFAQLMITYHDGSTEIIGTDGNWKLGHGPLLQAEIYDGECFDSRLDFPGWNEPSFVDEDWQPVGLSQLNLSILRAPDSPPVRRIQVLPAQTKLQSPGGSVILDFGQNLVGWIRCELSGPKGHTVRLIHAEVLDKGECATVPLRNAKCTDTIILSGDPLVYEPRFTFHGFRYVQIIGYAFDEVDLNNFRAIVIHTSMARTGWFECSDQMLNKLHENVVWSMKGNFVSVPTDCPQRDERLGWTGDLQAFTPTAAYLFDTGGILRTWLRGLACEQNEDGTGVPPLFSPNIWKGRPNISSAIWGDALISVPWDLYQASGDTALLAELHANMDEWLKKGVKRDENSLLWDPNHPQLGDWLEPTAPANDPGNGPTDEILVSNAFLIRMTDLMARISNILGHEEQGRLWEEQATELRAQFSRTYITDEGRVVSDTQTALALAIHFCLFPTSRQQDAAAARLVHLIKRNARFKIATGFAGTPILGHALNKINQHQLFYRMLVHRKPPSWLYPVTMGATTIWERWDSMLPDGTLNSSNMTSFNHYALGAVANWMHSTIAGIQPLEPGWKRIRISPVPGATVSSCHARFLSPYGEVDALWELKDDQLHLAVRIPGNTEAEVMLPGAETKCVGSGRHVFTHAYSRPDWPPLPIYPPFLPYDDDEP